MLSNVHKRRFETLGEMLAAMRVLRLRILNTMEPLGILLRKSDCEVLKRLGNSLWEGSNLSESWLIMRRHEGRRGGLLVCLRKEDLQIMDEFFHNLGRSGRDEQKQLFSSVIAEMEETQKHAKQCYADASRLYTALGTLVGIAICVLVV